MASTSSTSRPPKASTRASVGRPLPSVPVLSKTMSVAAASEPRASASLASTPSFASAPWATVIAVGTASDSAQGQLITSSASVTSSARDGSWMRQPM